MGSVATTRPIVSDQSPVTENTYDQIRCCSAEGSAVSALIAGSHDGGVCLANEQVGTSYEQFVCLLRRLFQCSWHLLLVISPRVREPRRFAQPDEAREGARVLHVDRPTLSQTATDVRGASRHEVLNGEYEQPSGLFVHHVGSCQRRSEGPEKVDTKSALLVDQLEQCLAFGRVWMNVVHQEPIGKRCRDRVETGNDEVQVVQGTLIDRATVRA